MHSSNSGQNTDETPAFHSRLASVDLHDDDIMISSNVHSRLVKTPLVVPDNLCWPSMNDIICKLKSSHCDKRAFQGDTRTA
jgi:hypothetical protein